MANPPAAAGCLQRTRQWDSAIGAAVKVGRKQAEQRRASMLACEMSELARAPRAALLVLPWRSAVARL